MGQPFLPTGKLNSFNAAAAGGGSGVAFPQGQLGMIIEVTDAEASALSDTSVGTLRAGRYQCVKAITTLVRGELVQWNTSALNGFGDYEVTSTLDVTNTFLAGVAIEAVTSGNFTWVQISGLATCSVQASPTNNTIGNVAVLTSGGTTNTLDAIADATDYFTTCLKFKDYVGRFYEAPGASGSASKKLIVLSQGQFFANPSPVQGR